MLALECMLLEFGHDMCHRQTLHAFDTFQLNYVYQVLLHALWFSMILE
jgi:hypothetical protein